jgi:endonuclease/exonuclease/phosphatase family metal-dependent hydrolase
VTRLALRVATYNVHGCVGLDGKLDADRVGAVIRELDADVVGLQEVDGGFRRGEVDQLQQLAAATGMQVVCGATRQNERGTFGNALLSRLPVLATRKADLSCRGREERGALDAAVDCDGVAVRVVATHFGLHAWERREQVRGLLQLVQRDPGVPIVVLGDFNEWSIINRTVRVLDAKLGASVAVRSFPSWWALFALDRLWARPRGSLEAVWAHRSRLARVASDHLPVVGRLSTGWPVQPARGGYRADYWTDWVRT